jgi:hypothetical protein
MLILKRHQQKMIVMNLEVVVRDALHAEAEEVSEDKAGALLARHSLGVAVFVDYVNVFFSFCYLYAELGQHTVTAGGVEQFAIVTMAN